eukprot:scaffold156726_cov15-Tisochrysis_lutea.AAC.1
MELQCPFCYMHSKTNLSLGHAGNAWLQRKKALRATWGENVSRQHPLSVPELGVQLHLLLLHLCQRLQGHQ